MSCCPRSCKSCANICSTSDCHLTLMKGVPGLSPKTEISSPAGILKKTWRSPVWYTLRIDSSSLKRVPGITGGKAEGCTIWRPKTKCATPSRNISDNSRKDPRDRCDFVFLLRAYRFESRPRKSNTWQVAAPTSTRAQEGQSTVYKDTQLSGDVEIELTP